MTVIRLDPEVTVEGLRERLMLHETKTPQIPGYDRREAFEAMWLIRQIIANRVAFPWVFGLHGPQTEAKVVADKTQFPGFETYPHLTDAVMANVYRVVGLANGAESKIQRANADHVGDAMTVATAPSVPPQWHVEGIAGWKRHKKPSPGPLFKFYKTVQGNDYYTTPMRSQPAHWH